MAIFIVMMIALILSVFAVILWSLESGSQTEIELIIDKKQAEFLAKGAQQHALLKFRYLPTELYDAVAYSIGKNPYYDFGRRIPDANTLDPVLNPGPMFFTGPGSDPVSRIEPDPNGVPIINRSGTNIYAPPAGATFPGDPRDTMGYLLRHYIADISSDYPTRDLASIVVISSQSHNDNAMGNNWRDPFEGNYVVRSLQILGLTGGKLYDRDSVLLTTTGSVAPGTETTVQISLVTDVDGGGTGEPRKLTAHRRVVSTATYSENTFPELESKFESLDEYASRTGARRSEIATGIYSVSRN